MNGFGMPLTDIEMNMMEEALPAQSRASFGMAMGAITRGAPQANPPGVGIGAGVGVVGPVATAAALTATPTTALAAVPAAGALAGVSIPPALMTLLGIAGAGYGIYQALGGGEGGGIGGINLLGGDTSYIDGIELQGPGLAEPHPSTIIKEWTVHYNWGKLQYYLVRMPKGGRKIALYNTRTKQWKAWRFNKPHLAVIGKNMPSHKQLTRLKRNLARHQADAKTILKITNPTAYAKQVGYRKARRRRS